MRVHLIASKVTDSVVYGFLPAAARLGLELTVLTDQPAGEAGTALTYWPLRQPGDRITVTHTNRDYLGVIRTVGPGPAAGERSVRDLRTSGSWPLTAPAVAP